MDLEYFNFYGRLGNRRKLNFKDCFSYWREMLIRKTLSIFEWKGLNFPQKEIEIPTIMTGFCGVTRFTKTKEIGVVVGGMNGVTEYPDEFTQYVYATPLESGIRNIDVDLVVVNNNEIRLPLIRMIEHYSVLLTHAELTMQSVLINSRSNIITTAKSQKHVDAINCWYKSLEDGKTLAILDDDDLNQMIGDKSINSLQTVFRDSKINDYYELWENVLKSFYNEIGIPSFKEKKAQMIENEANGQLSRAMFNVNDMLRQRKDACEKINKMFGTNWTVDFSEVIKANFEIETDVDSNDGNVNNKDNQDSKNDKGGEDND